MYVHPVSFVVELVSAAISFGCFAWFYVKSRSLRRPQSIESYAISSEGGGEDVARLIVRIVGEDGRKTAFFLSPGYAHKLSDELCTAAAKIAKKVA